MPNDGISDRHLHSVIWSNSVIPSFSEGQVVCERWYKGFSSAEISGKPRAVKFTQYFHAMRLRLDRAFIRDEWILQTIHAPVREVVQTDGRIRRWAPIPEMDGRFLRVIPLPDGETVHHAFFDRSFTP